MCYSVQTGMSSQIPSLDHLYRADFRLWSREVSRDRAYNTRKSWEKHISTTEFGQQPINCCTEEQTRLFFLDMDLGHDLKSVHLRTIKRLGKQAVKRGYLRYNPFEEVRLRRPPKGARRPKFWEPRTEVPKLFLAAKEPDIRDAYMCMYYGFMRKGDVRHLRWECVDFDYNTVTFLAEHTKSGREETIPMHPELRAVLLSRSGHRSGHLVFPSPRTGREFDKRYDWRIETTVKRAGIAAKRRSCHAFRHAAAVSAASGLWGERWEPSEVAKLLRDTTTAAVMVYYDILGDVMQDKMSRAVGLGRRSDSW